MRWRVEDRRRVVGRLLMLVIAPSGYDCGAGSTRERRWRETDHQADRVHKLPEPVLYSSRLKVSSGGWGNGRAERSVPDTGMGENRGGRGAVRLSQRLSGPAVANTVRGVDNRVCVTDQRDLSACSVFSAISFIPFSPCVHPVLHPLQTPECVSSGRKSSLVWELQA